MGEARRRGKREYEASKIRDEVETPMLGYVLVRSERTCEVCGQALIAHSAKQYTRFCSGQCRAQRHQHP